MPNLQLGKDMKLSSRTKGQVYTFAKYKREDEEKRPAALHKSL